MGGSVNDPIGGSFSQQGDPFGNDTPDTMGSSFGSQDPMSSSFASDPSIPQTNTAYPSAAPFPGQNRVAPREETEYEIRADTSHRDTELILAKLDAIKAELDSLHQRVRKIESVTDKGGTPRKITW